jgi:hypothetical protein
MRDMLHRTPTLLIAFLAAVATAAAQDAAPSPTPAAQAPATRDAPSIVLAPKAPPVAPASDPDSVTRSVSPGIAAALADGMPKFSPPTPTPVPVAETQEERDADKPRNSIPRLPAYVVRESRPPMFRTRDLLTPSGLVAFSLKNHPGLKFGNIFGLNDEVARSMYYDDERLTNMADMADTAHAMALGGDRAEAQYILQATQDTYMRTPDTTWGGPGGGGGFSGGGGK